MRTERARLSLYENLSEVLDRLARYESGNPLFILPIDDFDLNPPVCLGLLQLLRMISVPRLFTFVLGDVDMAEVVLNLKLSSALAEVAAGATSKDLLSILPTEAATMAGEIAAQSLRKLIPPAQRLLLQT